MNSKEKGKQKKKKSTTSLEETYSNIFAGFQAGCSGRAMFGEMPGPTACGIMTSDCADGESLLLSRGPLEIGGEMGWLR
jgi:hypothetical protein